MNALTFPHRAVVLAGVLGLLGSVASAGSLPQPEGEPILTISGTVANTNSGEVARFDRHMLEALGTAKIRTRTPWYDEVVEFEGVPMKALMDHVGASGTELTATALNDYKVIIPLSDFEEFDAILAMKRDGVEMPVRDKGPLFIIYPYDSDPQLQTDQYWDRSAWQVKELRIR